MGEGQLLVQDESNEGAKRGWQKPDADTSAWSKMDLPQPWEKAGLAIDGAVWFRRAVEVPAEWAGRDLVLSLGAIDDFDTTYFAGEEIGHTGVETPAYYSVPAHVHRSRAASCRPGRTVVAVRVFDHYGNGGFTGAAAELRLARKDGVGAALPLAGAWDYRGRAARSSRASPTTRRSRATRRPTTRTARPCCTAR